MRLENCILTVTNYLVQVFSQIRQGKSAALDRPPVTYSECRRGTEGNFQVRGPHMNDITRAHFLFPSESIYTGVDAQPASSQTGYKWSFAAKTTKADNDALRAARNEVGAATYNRAADPTAAGSGRLQGPTLPTQSDLTLAKELADEKRASERDLKRKRDRKEGKERLEEMVGPKEVGKEGMLEKKRAKREADKSFREKGDDGFDVDDDTLMGGGDSFKAQCVVFQYLIFHLSNSLAMSRPSSLASCLHRLYADLS